MQKCKCLLLRLLVDYEFIARLGNVFDFYWFIYLSY